MALGNLKADPGNIRSGPDCTVCLALETLPKEDAQVIRDALANPLWRYSQIAEQVSSDPDVPEWIRNIQHFTYRNHAVGRCAARTKLR